MTSANYHDTGLGDRLTEFIAWARSRIAECQRQELKFGNALPTGHGYPPQALVEAWTERRALQAALRIVTGRKE